MNTPFPPSETGAPTARPDHAPADGAGRPAHAVIGIDFGGTKTELALADPKGRVLARTRLETLAGLGPDQTLARTARAAHRLAAEAVERFGLPVLAHGAVAPGIIQPHRILLTPNLPGWEELALAVRLGEELGVP
ncbi:ROK family protein, partial [Kitasatospora sp. NPDC058965]|uniref:ROK family protein n=1 Tax=Kitasatospora sp. NPDC058965 TaxID=3346682 RepID=UPI0036ACBF08